MNPNRVRHVAQIGYHTDAYAIRLDAKSHGVRRIVGNRECVDLDIADTKPLSGHTMLTVVEITPGIVGAVSHET